MFIDAGRLITQFPDVQLWVNRIDPVSGTLYGIQIFEMEKKGAPRIVYADSATMEYEDNGATLMLRRRSGETHMTDADNKPSRWLNNGQHEFQAIYWPEALLTAFNDKSFNTADQNDDNYIRNSAVQGCSWYSIP